MENQVQTVRNKFVRNKYTAFAMGGTAVLRSPNRTFHDRRATDLQLISLSVVVKKSLEN